MRKILRHKQLRDKLLEGINEACDIIAETSGPFGHNVLIGEKRPTNDGVSIAKEIEFEDVFENAGALYLRSLCVETDKESGDATTATAIFSKSFASVDTTGLNVLQYRNAVKKYVDKAVKLLEDRAIQIDDPYNVAKISSESDEIAKIISDIFKNVGKDGVVKVEKWNEPKIDVEYKQGLEFTGGLLSKYMVNNKDKMMYVGKDVPVIAFSGVINDSIYSTLEDLQEAGHTEVLIVSNDVEEVTLNNFLKNIVEKTFRPICIKSPGVEDVDRLQDICSVVGTVDSDSQWGFAKEVKATEGHTIIIGDTDTSERIKNLKEREPESALEKKKLSERIAQLSGGIAIIKVGAETESATSYLYDKVEDAVKTSKKALEYGVIPGGGSELVRIAQSLRLQVAKGREERVALDSTIEALEAPIRQIVSNSGRDAGVVVHKILEGKSGYNVLTDKFEDDMYKAGVVDSLHAIRSALINASSGISILSTVNTAIIYETDKKQFNLERGEDTES